LLNHTTPQIRTMTPGDVSAGMRLKEAAGWNQTREDWERFLQANPEGCFVADQDGDVAGTVTTIIYENRLAWVGMVLVDAQLRGKGIGTALLLKAINYLDTRKIPCVKLDATTQGKPIYARLGFRVEYEIERHCLRREANSKASVALASDRAESIETVLKLDREVFGADRSDLLRSVAASAPELIVTTRLDDAVEGFALGRKGSRADHLGPWVASNAPAAREVFEAFLLRSRRNVVFVDVMKDNPWALALLAEKDFQFSRSLTRMYRGENAYRGRPDLLYSILGPEFG
jgi:ribosomal protein S18 acetylase RimI-like enzyme